MDFKIIQQADRQMLFGTPLYDKWKGEKMPDDKQTCFGCQHSHNMGAPNIDSKTCMDRCRRGSGFKPFNGERAAERLIAKGKILDRMVGFLIGTGFCMGESEYEKCLDCYSMKDCQQMLKDDLSLNPETQGSTVYGWYEDEQPDGPMSWEPESEDLTMFSPEEAAEIANPSHFVEPEGTVFKGITKRTDLEGLSNLQEKHPVKYSHSHEARPWPEGPMPTVYPKGPVEKRESYIDSLPAMEPGSFVELKAGEILGADVVNKLAAGLVHELLPKEALVSSDDKDGRCKCCDSRSLEMPDVINGVPQTDDGTMRTFESGATRDTNDGKLNFAGFLSLPALTQYAKYMSMNRLQSDGGIRDADNWKAGFPIESYVESAFRHYLDWLKYHQSDNRTPEMNNEGIAAVCGLIFNAMGFLHEWLKGADMVDFDGDDPTKEMQERRDAIKKLSETEDA